MPASEVVEAAVGAFRHSLAREHARRVLVLAAVGINAARVRIGARQVLGQEKGELRAPVLVRRRRDLRHPQVRERLRVVRPAHFAVAHAVAVLVGRGGRTARGPLAQQREALRPGLVERRVVCQAQRPQRGIARGERSLGAALERRRQVRFPERLQRAEKAVRAARGRGLRKRRLLRRAAARRDLREVAHPRAGDDRLPSRHADRREALGLPGPDASSLFMKPSAQSREQRVDPGVVELARDGREHRQRFRRRAELLAVARHLLAHVAQRVLGAALLELVQDDEVGEVQHVDLLELAGGAVVGGHDVQREVDEIHDLGVALPDARGLDHDQIEARRFHELDGVREHGGGREVLPARRQRAHE